MSRIPARLRLPASHVLLAALCCLLLGAGAHAQATQPGRLPLNYVPVLPRIGTAGMPQRDQFAAIADEGYQVVINLAPPGVTGSHRDEADLVAQQGMRYHNIAVDFAQPGAADYRQFAILMNQLRDARVLVHCQMNLRASTFVFLYRVLELGEDVDRAYDDVLRIWQPAPQWRRFISEALTADGKPLPLAFQP